MNNYLKLYYEIENELKESDSYIKPCIKNIKSKIPSELLVGFSDDTIILLFLADIVNVSASLGFYTESNDKVRNIYFLFSLLLMVDFDKLEKVLSEISFVEKNFKFIYNYIDFDHKTVLKNYFSIELFRKNDKIDGTNHLQKIISFFLLYAKTYSKYSNFDSSMLSNNIKFIEKSFKYDSIELHRLILTDSGIELEGNIIIDENVNSIDKINDKEVNIYEYDIKQVYDELDSFVGLNEVKNSIKSLVNYLLIQKERSKHNLIIPKMSLHCVFLGTPGTGKTSIARIIGKLYKNLGYLKKGHVVETDRADLIAGYVGQTALKVDEVITKAIDGILFIDEAYSLNKEDSQNDYGSEAINILLKRMEDYRDNLAVIVAGYKDEMVEFIESNPGLKSRFNRYFYFLDYIPDELIGIFKNFIKKMNYEIETSAEKLLYDFFQEKYSNRDKYFGNGRFVRNIFEKLIEIQANRLVISSNNSMKDLVSIHKEDVDTLILNYTKSIIN